MTWSDGLFGECIPDGPWLKSWGEAPIASTHPLCLGEVHVHGAPHMTLGSNVINLYHRWQEEAPFPFDFNAVRLFNPIGDGTVDAADLGLLLGSWGSCV